MSYMVFVIKAIFLLCIHHWVKLIEIVGLFFSHEMVIHKTTYFYATWITVKSKRWVISEHEWYIKLIIYIWIVMKSIFILRTYYFIWLIFSNLCYFSYFMFRLEYLHTMTFGIIQNTSSFLRPLVLIILWSFCLSSFDCFVFCRQLFFCVFVFLSFCSLS